MKKFIRSIVLSALAISFTAFAAQIERWNSTTSSYSGTTNIVLNVSTNGYFTIDVPKAPGAIAFSFTAKLMSAAGAGDRSSIDLELFRGIEQGRYETNAFLTHVVSGLSTTPFTSYWETNVASIPYLRGRFKNYSTNAVATNVLVIYGYKN